MKPVAANANAGAVLIVKPDILKTLYVFSGSVMEISWHLCDGQGKMTKMTMQFSQKVNLIVTSQVW